MSQTPNKIHLHIEELSLPGYSPAERRAFIAALERELACRGAAGTLTGAQAGSHQIVRINAPDLRPESVAKSAATSLPPVARRGGGRP